MTSHDRELLNRLVTKIVEIDGGEITTYSGNYDFYERQREVAARNKRRHKYARQQAMLAKEQAFHRQVKAAREPRAQVQSRVKKLDKIEKVEPPKRRKAVEFDFRPPPRSGDDRRQAGGRGEELRRTDDLLGPGSARAPPGALVRGWRERRGQVDLAQARGRRRQP